MWEKTSYRAKEEHYVMSLVIHTALIVYKTRSPAYCLLLFRCIDTQIVSPIDFFEGFIFSLKYSKTMKVGIHYLPAHIGYYQARLYSLVSSVLEFLCRDKGTLKCVFL